MSAGSGTERIELTRSLRELAAEMGAEIFGVSPAGGFLDEDYQGGRPQDVMGSACSVVVAGVPLLTGPIEALPQGRPEHTNSLLAASITLRFICYRPARRLERAGSLFVKPSG